MTYPMVFSPEPLLLLDCEWAKCNANGWAFAMYGCLEGHTGELVLCSNHYDQWVATTKKCGCGLTIEAVDAIGVKSIHHSWFTDMLRDQSARKVQAHFKHQNLPSVFPSIGVNIGPIRNIRPNFKNMEELKKYYRYKKWDR
jgi:hypothetical protein